MVMRNLMITLLLVLVSSQAYGADEVLFDGEVEYGGFGAPVVKVTSVNGDAGVLVGAWGAWLINHQLAIGAGGYGLSTDIDASGETNRHYGRDLEIGMGYGGIILEHIHSSNSLYHLTESVLVGGGGITLSEDRDNYDEDEDVNDGFFVVEPGISGELNVSRWFRVSAGVSYRFAAGVDLPGIDDGDLSGPAGSLTFKFGAF